MSQSEIGHVTADEQGAVLQLLINHHLPTEGLSDHWATTLVARVDGGVVGSAALEVYPDGALLRSVAVAESARGRGVGLALTQAAMSLAAERALPAMYLLTTTAERYFPRFGFDVIQRADVPATVQRSVEFTAACPSSAIVMRKRL